MNDTTEAEISHYYRKTFIALLLVILSVIVLIVINTLNATIIH